MKAYKIFRLRNVVNQFEEAAFWLSLKDVDAKKREAEEDRLEYERERREAERKNSDFSFKLFR